MSRAFYLNLAVDNLKKNARTIIPYILTSVLTTMMLYMVVSLANNPNLNEMLGAMTLTQMLGFGVVIIEIFAFIFLFYTHSFLIKRRQKEFALFSILGMEKKHLARNVIKLAKHNLFEIHKFCISFFYGLRFISKSK